MAENSVGGRTVLVTVASKHGAIEEIAQLIGETIAAAGFAVTVIPASQVEGVDNYDAVVLGSAVYTGRWLPAAKHLVARSGSAMASRPVWLFSSGPVGDPDGKLARAMNQDPPELASIQAATHARGHKMFAGKLDPRKLGFAQRATLLAFRGLRGDFRDWAEIKGWADDIARDLAVPTPR